MNNSPHYLDYFTFLLLGYTIWQPGKPISTKTKNSRLKTKNFGIPYFYALSF